MCFYGFGKFGSFWLYIGAGRKAQGKGKW